MPQMRTLIMISGLSERSGVPVSTIKFYIREKLLPPGVKANRTTVYYGREHINRLRLIKHLRGEGYSLRRIKSLLKNQVIVDRSESSTPSARRENIIDAAAPLFMKYGLERTSITDITQSARISRNTFYREFKSKRDAFVACLDRIFTDMIDAFNSDISSKMAVSRENGVWDFLGIQTSWSDFMNLLGATIVNDPPLLNSMLDDFIQRRARRISCGFDHYVEKGRIRPVDTGLLGLIVLGMIDYCSRFLRNGTFTDAEEMYAKAIDILINGIKNSEKEKAAASSEGGTANRIRARHMARVGKAADSVGHT
ncbi:MAG: MerR family transcriptional regulator [Desulfobacterales bacterium]